MGCVALLLAAAIDGAAAQAPQQSACKYEENCECAAPGITLRWKAAYCMAAAATDDLEIEPVQRCLARRDPAAVRRLSACAQNRYWKRRLCGVVRKHDARPCVDDKAFIPAIVERGQ